VGGADGGLYPRLLRSRLDEQGGIWDVGRQMGVKAEEESPLGIHAYVFGGRCCGSGRQTCCRSDGIDVARDVWTSLCSLIASTFVRSENGSKECLRIRKDHVARNR
jgi:hypothetical protein